MSEPRFGHLAANVARMSVGDGDASASFDLTSSLDSIDADKAVHSGAKGALSASPSLGTGLSAVASGAAAGAVAANAIDVGVTAGIAAANIAVDAGASTAGAIAAGVSSGATAAAEAGTIGASTAIGSELGPLGAAIGVVIGLSIAFGGAAAHKVFEGTDPSEIFKELVLYDYGSTSAPTNISPLTLDVLTDKASAEALTTWGLVDNFSAFDSWFKLNFLNAPTAKDKVTGAHQKIRDWFRANPEELQKFLEALKTKSIASEDYPSAVFDFASSVAAIEKAIHSDKTGRWGTFTDGLHWTDDNYSRAGFGPHVLTATGDNSSGPGWAPFNVGYFYMVINALRLDALTVAHEPKIVTKPVVAAKKAANVVKALPKLAPAALQAVSHPKTPTGRGLTFAAAAALIAGGAALLYRKVWR